MSSGGATTPSVSDVDVEPNASPGFSLVPFVRSAGILSISSIANLVRAIVTAKVLAVALGPAQVGVISQLFNFSALLFTLLTVGLTTGVAKMVAESSRENGRANLVVGSATLIALVSGVAGAVLVAPIASNVSTSLTGSPRYAFAVIVIVASFPLSNVASVVSYILQGLADVKRLAAANVAAAVLSLVFLVPATIIYGLNGAAVSVLVASILQSAVFIAALALAYGARQWRLTRALFSVQVSRQLLSYGGVILVGGIGIYASVLAVRTIALHELGATANGLYQVVYGLSSQYIAVFMTWMAAYVFPRVAAETHRSRLGPLLNSALRANLVLMVPGLVAVVSLRVLLVHIFYSQAFVGAADYIPVQVLGDFARVLGWSFGVSLFAQGYKGGHLVANLVQAVAWVSLTSLTLPWIGLGALSLGYALSYVTWPVLMYWMARQWLGVRIESGEMAMVGVGLVCIVAAVVVPQPLGLIVAPVVPVLIYMRRHRGSLAPVPRSR